MKKTNKVNAIIIDDTIRPNSKLPLRIDYSIFGEYKIRTRCYTHENFQRFITSTKLYRIFKGKAKKFDIFNE